MLAIFEATPSIKHKAMIVTTYAAGLRISDVCALRKSDIGSRRMRIYVHLGKGKKDRFALLSLMALELLKAAGTYPLAHRNPRGPSGDVRQRLRL